MATFTYPDLLAAIEAGLRAEEDTWDESKVHVSDLGYAIPIDEGGKCARQLWLRLRGAEKREPHVGELLMFDRGNSLHEALTDFMRDNLPDGWVIAFVEHKVVEEEAVKGLDGVTLMPDEIEDGRLDVELHGPNGEVIIVDYKTVRGRAMQFLDIEKRPYETHRLQVQTYARGRDADGALILYADREGQNWCRLFPVERDDERVVEMAKATAAIANALEAPPIISAKLVRNENKGADSLKIDEPWQCARCPYKGLSCPGAVPEDVTTGRVVANIKNDGTITFKADTNPATQEAVEALLWHA